MSAAYDTIGRGYAALRRPDPRIAAAIREALGNAHSVVNVGAGTGSYEPADCSVIAVEPSAEMIAQRPPGSAPAVQASAEHLPFPDKAFDAAMAVLTVHHWGDRARGLAEMRRVARGPVVILTFDPAHPGTWLTDYLPQLRSLDAQIMPPLEFYREHLGPVEIRPLPIPHDCSDGFLYAYWRRPEAYLDPQIRAGISSFHRLDCKTGLEQLAQDLENGEWEATYGDLRALMNFDAGYHLVIAE
ncbi:class I SAM-dependent methyltransferase [Tsuneonella sp. HG222]